MYAALVLLAITLIVNVVGIGLLDLDPAQDFGEGMTDIVAHPIWRRRRTAGARSRAFLVASRGRCASVLLTVGAWAVALLAAVPLFSVLYMLIVEGGARLSLELFTELPPAGFELGGGFGNAIVGTLVMVGIAAADQRSRSASWPPSTWPSSGPTAGSAAPRASSPRC